MEHRSYFAAGRPAVNRACASRCTPPLGKMTVYALYVRVQARTRYSLDSHDAALIGFGVSHHCFMKRRA